MLTTLRNNAQSWIIKVLLGIIVVTFVISFGVGTFSNPKEVLVQVGNREILVSEYLKAYQNDLERLRQRFPDNADTLAAQINLRKQVLDRMVNRYLLLTAARSDGLAVNTDEVRNTVTGQAAFQVNGHFDFGTYRQVLAQNRLTPAEYESRLHDDLLMGKYQRHQIAGIIVGKAEVDQRYRIENERVEVDYAFVDPAKIELPRAPTDAEVKTYYDAHPDQFTQPAQFKLRYMVLPLSALEGNVQIRDRAVEHYYERNVEREFTTPKRVRASHILMRLPKDATPEQEAKARSTLESVLAKARAGADFAKLAKQYSQDLSASKGGDLGFFSRTEMVPAFADAAFALPDGGISDIVKSPFGLHIIKVTAVKPGSRKPLEAVRKEIVAKLRTQRAERRLQLELERLPSRLQKDGLDSVAKGFNRPVKTTDFFDEQAVLPALGSAAPLYAQLSKHRKGDVGVWKRNPVQGHVFYEIADRKNAFVRPLPAVKAQALQAVGDQQRRQQAVASAKGTIQKLQDGKVTLAAFARSLGLKVQTVSFTVVDNSIEGLGVNHEFQRAAFGLSKEKPYALNIKDEKAYLIRFKRRYLPDPGQEPQAKKSIADRMQQDLQQYVMDREIDRLRSRVKVDVLAPEYLASNSSTPVRTPRTP